MTDTTTAVSTTYITLADLLESSPDGTWDAPSLCAGWQVRHVVAHVTMPLRLTPERFGAEMAAAGGDFTTLSNTIAERDSQLPTDELLAALRSPELHDWTPPRGGAAGALNHAVIHSLDITIPLGVASVAPDAALTSVLDALLADGGAIFGVDAAGVSRDTAAPGELVALLSGRTLPDGRSLPQR
jgi:uncharacterized protein (TIGR03083 family)